MVYQCFLTAKDHLRYHQACTLIIDQQFHSRLTVTGINNMHVISVELDNNQVSLPLEQIICQK